MAFNALAELLSNRKVKPSQLGSGLLERAASPMASDADYQAYVVNTQEKGEQALPRDQWIKMQRNG